MGYGWTWEHLRAHTAKRARQIATLDGKLHETAEKQVAEVLASQERQARQYNDNKAITEAIDRATDSMACSIATIENVVGGLMQYDALIGRIPEREVMPAVMGYLAGHPKVAWVSRINVGGSYYGGSTYVRHGEPGMSDITGQLVDGRRLECEIKASDGTVSAEQQAWIDRVNLYGGVAFAAWSIDDVIRVLGEY